MRAIKIAAILLIALAGPTHAQTLTVNSVALSLGENEVRARADIASAGMDLFKFGASPDSFSITVKRDTTYDYVGNIAFANGRVKWVQRAWYLNQTPDDKNTLASIFYNAASSLLEGVGRANCTVSVKTSDNSPSSGVSKITTIECMKPAYSHSLILMSVDCSAGCSIGNITGSLEESIKQNQE